MDDKYEHQQTSYHAKPSTLPGELFATLLSSMLLSKSGLDERLLATLSVNKLRTNGPGKLANRCDELLLEQLCQKTPSDETSEFARQSIYNLAQTLKDWKSVQPMNASCVREPAVPKSHVYVQAQQNEASLSIQCTSEMVLSNDLIGCIIGRGGTKINEIRQTSQATIKISSGEDGAAERRITITGTRPAVQVAQTMINNSIELHKHLVALNLAMDSFYQSRAGGMGDQQAWRTLNADTHVDAALTTRRKNWANSPVIACTGEPSFEYISAMTTDDRDFSHVMPDSISINTTSSVLQGGNSDLSSHTSKVHHACITSKGTANTASGTGLESTGDINRKQVLELIGQLPLTDQKRWLAAFRM